MATTSATDLYLTEQLIFIILSWVPAISLFRFKSVCKSWCEIISSPTFIETHLINSNKKQPSSLISLSRALSKKSHHINDAVYIHTVDNDPFRINLPQKFIGKNCCFRSCNGLLFHDNVNGFTDSLNGDVSFIWNPLTKGLKILPNPEKQAKRSMVNLGFGFDSVSNDYKILRIVRRAEYFCFVLEAELYSANGDSWKEIDGLQSFMPDKNSKFVHVNGVLYLDAIRELLAFDLHEEVFRVMSFPLISCPNSQKHARMSNVRNYLNYNTIWIPDTLQHTRMSHVLDYEGKAAMIFKEENDSGLVLSLWTLDKRWTRRFDLEADLKVLWVFLYLGVGQFVVGDYNGEYVLYDHRKKQTTKFPLEIFLKEAKVAMYTESLVSLEGFEQHK